MVMLEAKSEEMQALKERRPRSSARSTFSIQGIGKEWAISNQGILPSPDA